MSYKKKCFYANLFFIGLVVSLTIAEAEILGLSFLMYVLLFSALSFVGIVLWLSTSFLSGISPLALVVFGFTGSFFQWAYLFPWVIKRIEKKMIKKISIENKCAHTDLMRAIDKIGMDTKIDGNEIALFVFSRKNLLRTAGGMLLFEKVAVVFERDTIVLKHTFNGTNLLMVFFSSVFLHIALLFTSSYFGISDETAMFFQPIILITIFLGLLSCYMFSFENALVSEIEKITLKGGCGSGHG